MAVVEVEIVGVMMGLEVLELGDGDGGGGYGEI